MDSSSSSNPQPPSTKPRSNISYSSSPSPIHPNSSPNTTFVQADPSNFRTIVQKLTGPDQDTLLLPLRYAGKPTSGEMGPRRQPFKLHERRLQSARKLEINLHNGAGSTSGSAMEGGSFIGLVGEMVMVSPVSPLEMILSRGSPSTPRSPSEEEGRAIAGKGFYLHPSPLSTPRGSEPPELLPLFPLSSPRYNDSPTDS